MKQDVIAIFDIGKTNKKILLFDKQLKLVYQNERKIDEILDEDGFSCDDLPLVEEWILEEIQQLSMSKDYILKAVNFATYGATLIYLDKDGKRLTPAYNYLKPMPENVLAGFYQKYGGIEEFSRKTASPALGMLNSGLQILWLKKHKPEIFAHVSNIVHLPQYFYFLLSKKITSELTSIGCHTAMWDFDNNCYHAWLAEEKIELPLPVINDESTELTINDQKFQVGIGIHDSSSSLVPYLKGSSEPFILISTGTWCIFMNPFNDEPLTAEQLGKDSLCYISTRQKQVKSSRLFMGHIHDVNSRRIADHYGIKSDYYKSVEANEVFINNNLSSHVFFKNGISADYIDSSVDLSVFSSPEEAYHQLVIDITSLAMDSLQLVIPENDGTKSVYVTGGFARNVIFVRLMAALLPHKKIFTSEVDNATAFGAAITLWNKTFTGTEPILDLGLKKIEAFKIIQ
jgi:sugar (pentulose or hexulose) kinase